MRALVLSSMAVLAAGAPAEAWETPVSERGSWISLEVAVDDQAMPLHASTDGRRYYVEARAGGRYDVRLTNRTGERLGVEVTVDGLNVISGERDHRGPDRLYILGPWEGTTIRGWRTSLDEVRRFTFVDERASYAARSGKANSKMGWIEVAVYRERFRPAPQVRMKDGRTDDRDSAPRAEAQEAPRDRAAGAAPAPIESYPGTGWGDAVPDHVRLVDFEGEATPVESLTVRYEYRAALEALGVLPRRPTCRLDERERGDGGFAKPPRR